MYLLVKVACFPTARPHFSARPVPTTTLPPETSNFQYDELTGTPYMATSSLESARRRLTSRETVLNFSASSITTDEFSLVLRGCPDRTRASEAMDCARETSLR